jgi:hypothetical protein
MALSGVEGPFDKLTTPSEVEGPQEYYLYFEDFEPKPDTEFGRQPKFCNGLVPVSPLFSWVWLREVHRVWYSSAAEGRIG